MPMKIILKGEKPISWNKLYAGRHWIYRQQEAERVHQLVRSQLEKVSLLQGRVDILITVYFSGRSLDPDNISSKFYIDGLKDVLIEDDTRQQVRWVATRSEIDKKDPRVEIEVKNVLEN